MREGIPRGRIYEHLEVRQSKGSHRATCTKFLARQRTHECRDVAARLHSGVRRQSRTWAHDTAGSNDDRSPFKFAVARKFMGHEIRSGTRARIVPE